MTAQNFRTGLKKEKGLGAAYTGVRTWFALRVSAVALIMSEMLDGLCITLLPEQGLED
ncbi:MAG: hypothetical protein K0R63_11 [Rickettsiales bacterium]|jgi:succinate dehydrogenase hydrophobic anchor subunit|nr:hypothetical protein [Rickettsiales bacterium]